MRTNDLTELYQHEGPFAGVTIDVSHDSETGAHEHQLQVRAACEALIEAGADDKVVQLLSERLGELVDDSSPVGRAVVAWSALRYQRTVDNVWKENAEAVADEVLHHVRAGIRLVLLAGEPQSKPVVRDALESTDADVVDLSTGTRAEDGGDEAFAQAIRGALLEHTMARRLRLSHELRERLGQDRAVATGVDDVADAFVRGQVETLLLDRQAAAERPLDVSRHPGLAFGAVVPEGFDPAHQGLVAAATVTGADVAFGRASTFGGAPVAALLRWDQPAEGATT